MKPDSRLLPILAVSLACLLSCTHDKPAQHKSSNPKVSTAYVTLDGLWKSTPQTALHFGEFSMEPVIFISGSIVDKLRVRGCFSWKDGLFYDYWWLNEIEYDEEQEEVIFHDREGSTFIGKLNEDKDSILGMIYQGYPDQLEPEDRLDLIRAVDLDYEQLFVPLPAGPDGSIRYSYQKPEQLNDGLTAGSIYAYINDSARFTSFLEDVIRQEYGRLESLLILKNKELVLEEYFYGFDREETHNTHSCTKSIVSMLAGLALTEHGQPDTDQSILSFFPDLDISEPEKVEKVTLQHVLTMSAGFTSDESYFGMDQAEIPDFILELPLETEPGEECLYNSECPYLLGSIICALSGMTVEAYAREKLFGPLGISNYYWEKENGVVHCHSDLHLVSRDMAKIGLMALNQGKWGGHQIIPAQWLAESTRSQIKKSDFFDYGYQWWFRSAQNKSWWKEGMAKNESEHDMALALGFGGQYIMIVRDLDLVVVITSSDYNESTGLSFKKIPMVIEEIVPLFE